MPRRKTSAKTKSLDYQSLFVNTLKDKYQYLLLGITVLLIFYISFTGLIPKNKVTTINTQTTVGNNVENKKVNKPSEKINPVIKKYIVKAGDYLWKIAEEVYGSGYNAYDIASSNNISNPSIIYAGQQLVLPSVSPKTPTQGEIVVASTTKVTITQTKYVIQKGDSLWTIAIGAYGDGYAWLRIAKANNLINPDLIHVDNTLIIPR